jgi:hypothetical protein
LNEATSGLEPDLSIQRTVTLNEIEKFAESIVAECMQVLDPGEHQLIARFQARKWLAEHFGVEK